MTNTIDLPPLISWISDPRNRVYMSPLLQVKKSPLGGYGVFPKQILPYVPEEEDIDEDNVLVKVHESSILSSKRCFISNLLLDEGMNSGIKGLALSFIYEKELGNESPWYEYILSFIYKGPKGRGFIKPACMLKDKKGKISEFDDIEGLDEKGLKKQYSECCAFAVKVSKVVGIPGVLNGNSFDEYCGIALAVSSRATEMGGIPCLVPCVDLFNTGSTGNEIVAFAGVEEEEDEEEDEEVGDEESDDGEREEPAELTEEWVAQMAEELAAEEAEDCCGSDCDSHGHGGEDEGSDSEWEDEDEWDEDPFPIGECCDILIVAKMDERAQFRNRELLLLK